MAIRTHNPRSMAVLFTPACRSLHAQDNALVGDLLVFPSGATIHEVTEVQDGERWTMGGFAAFAPAGDPLYAWG